MMVKISVFAVVLIMTYVSAIEVYPPSTLSLSMPYMPNYPPENTTFNEFKKSVYTLNQALFNIIASARSVYNYYSLYKNQPGPNLEICEKKDKFEKALSYFEKKLLEYRQSLVNYKTLLDYKTPPIITMGDDISIDSDLL